MENSEAIGPEFLKRISKISRESAVFLAGNLFMVVAGLSYKVYVARTIGTAGVGIFALGMTIVTVAGALASFGLASTAVRFIPLYSARGEKQRIRRFCFSVVLVLCACQ